MFHGSADWTTKSNDINYNKYKVWSYVSVCEFKVYIKVLKVASKMYFLRKPPKFISEKIYGFTVSEQSMPLYYTRNSWYNSCTSRYWTLSFIKVNTTLS